MAWHLTTVTWVEIHTDMIFSAEMCFYCKKKHNSRSTNQAVWFTPHQRLKCYGLLLRHFCEGLLHIMAKLFNKICMEDHVPWMLPLGWGLKQWVKTPKAVPDKKNWHLFYAYLQSNWQGWEDTSTGGSSPAALGWSPQVQAYLLPGLLNRTPRPK